MRSHVPGPQVSRVIQEASVTPHFYFITPTLPEPICVPSDFCHFEADIAQKSHLKAKESVNIYEISESRLYQNETLKPFFSMGCIISHKYPVAHKMLTSG